MNLLAFDTSTESMSIAVARTVDGVVHTWQHTGVGGAQASTGLIAAVLDLMQQAQLNMAQLDAICFGSGPGSFTGLRTACSVAQGFAFGVKVPVLPVDSLLAVAEEARHGALSQVARGEVLAMLDARMDEIYTARYAFDAAQWTEVMGSRLVRPENLHPAEPPHVLAGNVFALYGERLAAAGVAGAGVQCVTALPTASAMLRLAPQLLAQGKAVSAEHALPLYIRDKVAKTTLERETEKAAAKGLAL